MQKNKFYKLNKMADVAKLNENDKDVTAVSTEVTKTQDNVNTPSNETPTTEKEETETKEVEEVTQEINPMDDEMNLEFLDKEFVYDCMSGPTHSKKEFRMVTFIILWARRNNIKYEFDDYGNVYLTKGELNEGEFYPCVTSHLDTVQSNQDPYIYAGVPLDLVTTRTKDGYHKVAVDSLGGASIGIGADDKSGICICLSIFNYVDKLKACFFLDEETGCNGSDHLDENWFKDVGYVIGYDSPDLYRAAWSCSGVPLFNKKFYLEQMKQVCDRWGLKQGCFFSEPYTDVKNIRTKTDIICMNFGNGGYNPHMQSEYIIIEDMDHACGMGVDLIEYIGCTEHKLKHVDKWKTPTEHAYKRHDDGTYECVYEDDTEFMASLGDNKRTTYYNKTYTPSSNNTSKVKNDSDLKLETVKYIIYRYDSYISNLKEDILKSLKEHCDKNNIKSDEIENIITEKFANDIKF